MPGSGLVSMIDTDRVGDLQRMYVLFNRVPENVGRDALRMALRMDIEDRGKAINQAAVDQPEAGRSGAARGPVSGNRGGDDRPGMDVDTEDDPKGKGKAKAPIAPTVTGGTLASALRWVQDVLDLKDKFDRMLDQAFGGDKSVQTSINEVGSRRIESVLSLWSLTTRGSGIGISIVYQRKSTSTGILVIVH